MQELIDWFRKNKRELPWRNDPTPYKVWISEVMLQQTRAAVVSTYFERWMDLFPDIFTLAEAPLDKVIKVWEGLGYYSRARNLHRGARQIVEQFGGNIPSNPKDLSSIRGIGPYTIGAILSFGFRQKAAAVDGNVTRVISRYFLIEENVSKASVRRQIALKTEACLQGPWPWVVMEAFIELGATVCRPKPDCERCPLKNSCLGKHRAEWLPVKNSAPETIFLKRAVCVIEREGKVLVRKGRKGEIMEDLYEFPYFDMEDLWTHKEIVQAITDQLQVVVEMQKSWEVILQTFTRYRAKLYPFLLKAACSQPVKGCEWVLKSTLRQLPFSSGHRRVCEYFTS